MNIAQIVPVWGPYIPEYSRGINAVARDLSRGLVKKGHKVKIIAPLGSRVDKGMELAETIVSASKRSFSLFDRETIGLSLIHAQKAIQFLQDVDVVHNHMEYLFLPMVKFLKTPVVSTIHGTEFPPEAISLFQSYPEHFFIAISQRAVANLPFINFKKVIYNGIDLSKYKFSAKKKDFLLWMGRMTPEKGAHLAIEVAKKTGIKLILAGLKEKREEDYFQKIYKEAKKSAKITLLGRLSEEEKSKLLSEGRAFLFPILWEEPFGLVMAEAMACGTPVIGFERGSVSEIVKDGVTGFVVPSEEGVSGLISTVRKLEEINPSDCRQWVEEKFTLERMVEGYEKVYKMVVERF